MAKRRLSASQAFAVSVLLAALLSGVYAWYLYADGWAVGIAVLCIAIAATSLPIGQALLQQIALDAAPVWMEEATNLGAEQQRVVVHYKRLKGTLVYWKNQAAAHHRLHMAGVFWSLSSAVLLPVLVQYYDVKSSASNAFMTILTTWTGFVVAVAYTLKSEQRYQGMRQQESDYYDLARSFLDSIRPDDPQLTEKVDLYIKNVDRIRRTARKVETGSPPSALDA